METPTNVNEALNEGYNPHSTAGNTFWNKNEFDGAINDRGYDCTTEKAIRCPCISVVTGSPLPSCQNCGGTGWVYIKAKQGVKIVLQGMAYNDKYFNWTQANTATARATLWDIEKLVYMDKITIENATTDYSQNTTLQEYDNKIFAFTTYPIEEVGGVYAFIAPNEKLKVLEEGLHYTFEKGKNILFFTEKVLNLPNKNISIRYKHKPQYVIIDILRDVIQQVITKGSDTTPKLENLPNSYIARRLHFAMNTDFLGNNVLLNNG